MPQVLNALKRLKQAITTTKSVDNKCFIFLFFLVFFFSFQKKNDSFYSVF